MKIILTLVSISLGSCVAYTPAPSYYVRPYYATPYQPTPCYVRYPYPHYYSSSPSIAIQYRPTLR